MIIASVLMLCNFDVNSFVLHNTLRQIAFSLILVLLVLCGQCHLELIKQRALTEKLGMSLSTFVQCNFL